MLVEKYVHHGTEVTVISELKGKHRDHCLCYQCGKFFPCKPDNCEIAEAIYKNCVDFNLVTPVYECASFENLEKSD